MANTKGQIRMSTTKAVKWFACIAVTGLLSVTGAKLLAETSQGCGAVTPAAGKATTMKDVSAKCMALDAAVKSEDLAKIHQAATALNMCLSKYKPSMESVSKEADYQKMCEMQMDALKKVGTTTTAADAAKQVAEAKKSCACCHAKYKKM